MPWPGVMLKIPNEPMTRLKSARRLDGRTRNAMLIAGLLSIVLLSCGGHLSHENFLTFAGRHVGSNMEEVNPTTRVTGYVDGRILANGNSEYGFKYWKTCRVYYEVDPETRIIVDWRWEGLRKDCVAGG